jgi:plasmid stabilization system protein ParE
MTYRVIYTQRLLSDIRQQLEYLRRERVEQPTIDRWFSTLFDAVDGLSEWPERCPVVAAKSQRFGFEVRKLNFEDFLLHYRVNPEARTVYVLSFQRGSRQR